MALSLALSLWLSFWLSLWLSLWLSENSSILGSSGFSYWWHQHSGGICLEEAWKEVKSHPSGFILIAVSVSISSPSFFYVLMESLITKLNNLGMFREIDSSQVKRQIKYLSLDPIQWKWFYPTLKPKSKLSPIEAHQLRRNGKRLKQDWFARLDKEGVVSSSATRKHSG